MKTIHYETSRVCAQHVDLFAKDYVFVPIHEALHWSLALICHPANWDAKEGQPPALILHFDSMDGGSHKLCRAV